MDSKYIKLGFRLSVVVAVMFLFRTFAGGGGLKGVNSAPPAAPYTQPAQMPPLGESVKVTEGVKLHIVTLNRKPNPSHLYIYLPEKSSAKPLPVVLIAPAGSRLFHGMELGEGDVAEHVPYAQAGYAVVAYELDGPVAENASDKDIIEAALRFQNAKAGLENAKTALDYALARIPNIDKNRIYTAGHSSAATASLVVAENEPRIRACIAYAPGVDPESWIGPQMVNDLSLANTEYKTFIHNYSPINATEKLSCPTFIFHAEDDTTVKKADVEAFVEKLKKTNSNVTYAKVPSGGHYDSMIEQGIPQGIEWLNKQI